MTDKIEISIVRSYGKDCLSVDDNIVAGPWGGVGSTVKTFMVSIEDLERIIAEHKEADND